jgi:hypothetical protein
MVILRGNSTDLDQLTTASQSATFQNGIEAYFPGSKATVAGGWDEQLSGWKGGDSTPPQITLLPPEVVMLPMFQNFSDPGALPMTLA